MENTVKAQIKRGLKVTTDYLVTLVVFVIFLSIVFNVAKTNLQTGVFIFSIIIFLVLFTTIYINMSEIAFREKRPQYAINPSPYKGFLYGLIGTVPIFLLQLIYYVILFNETLVTFQRRVLQGVTGPLYWLASLISDKPWAYHVVLLVIPVMAGLGYLAGYHEVYLLRKLKIFNKKKKDVRPPVK